jgi:hypothetical protein
MADALRYKNDLPFLVVFSIAVFSTLGFTITIRLLCKRRRRDSDSYKIDEERGPIKRKMSLPYKEGPRKNSLPTSTHPPRGKSLARRNDTIESVPGRKTTLQSVSGDRNDSSHSVGHKGFSLSVGHNEILPVVVCKYTLHSVSSSITLFRVDYPYYDYHVETPAIPVRHADLYYYRDNSVCEKSFEKGFPQRRFSL